MALHELIMAGGPQAMARQAANLAAQQERRLGLTVLEEMQQQRGLDFTDAVYAGLVLLRGRFDGGENRRGDAGLTRIAARSGLTPKMFITRMTL
jgi:hypothetical protein